MTNPNPYRAPASPLIEQKHPHKVWWLYLALCSIASAFGTVVFALSSRPFLSASFAIDAVCTVGLFFYIRNKPVVSVQFWQIVLGLFCIKTIIAKTLYIQTMIEYWHGFSWSAFVELFLSALLTIPLAYAIWRYSFKSPELWRRAAGG